MTEKVGTSVVPVFVWLTDKNWDGKPEGVGVDEFMAQVEGGKRMTVWHSYRGFEAHVPDNLYAAEVTGYIGLSPEAIAEHFGSWDEQAVRLAVTKYLEDAVEALNQC